MYTAVSDSPEGPFHLQLSSREIHFFGYTRYILIDKAGKVQDDNAPAGKDSGPKSQNPRLTGK